jgi:hypothetical protein
MISSSKSEAWMRKSGSITNQVGVECRMVDFRERQVVRHDRLSQLLVGIHDDGAASRSRVSGSREMPQRPPYALKAASQNVLAAPNCFSGPYSWSRPSGD